MFKTPTKLLTLTCLVVILASCGGGGGNDATSTETEMEASRIIQAGTKVEKEQVTTAVMTAGISQAFVDICVNTSADVGKITDLMGASKSTPLTDKTGEPI